MRVVIFVGDRGHEAAVPRLGEWDAMNVLRTASRMCKPTYRVVTMIQISSSEKRYPIFREARQALLGDRSSRDDLAVIDSSVSRFVTTRQDQLMSSPLGYKTCVYAEQSASLNNQ